MTDGYSKGVLTVIAAALLFLAVQQMVRPAQSGKDCGTMRDPCYVSVRFDCATEIDRTAPCEVKLRSKEEESERIKQQIKKDMQPKRTISPG
jgi:hypothetical protein